MSTTTSNAYKRGIAFQSRYWATWIVTSAGQRPDLHCNFDHLEDAINHIAEHPETHSGGVWDRHERRWVL
jgi:hypothetical protein